MAITIQGVRLKSVDLRFDDQGTLQVTGAYQLLSNTGVVLANQSFNGYSDVKIPLPAAVAGQLNQTLDGIRAELNKTLGLE
jgi:hypothetical protein